MKMDKIKMVCITTLSLILMPAVLMPVIIHYGIDLQANATSVKPKVEKIDEIFNMRGVAINPITNKLYLLDAGISGSERSVRILDAGTIDPINSISAGSYPHAITVNPNTGMSYLLYSCDCPQNRSISVIDGITDSIVSTIENATIQAYQSIHVNPITNKVYVSDGHSISEIDGNTNEIIRTESFGIGNNTVWLVAINPNLNKIYGVDFNKTIFEVHLDSLKLYSMFSIDSVPNARAIDNYPVGMLVNPSTNLLYIINMSVFPPASPNAGFSIPVAYLMVVDPTSRKIISHDLIAEITGFLDLAVDPMANMVYVMTRGNSFIAIDGKTNAIIDRFHFDVSDDIYDPRKMVINPESGDLYFISPNAVIMTSRADIMVHRDPRPGVVELTYPEIQISDVESDKTSTSVSFAAYLNTTDSQDPQPYVAIFQARDINDYVTFIDIREGRATSLSDESGLHSVVFNWTKPKYQYVFDTFVVDTIEKPSLLAASKYVMDDFSGEYYEVGTDAEQLKVVLSMLRECEADSELCDSDARFWLYENNRRCEDYWSFSLQYYNPICWDSRLYRYETIDTSGIVE